jgi:chromosome segregation ATPase
MGQAMEKFGNTINGFYEKASNWAELSESEKAEFISDNAELFKGEGGADLLKAFESGDYEIIEQKLAQQMSEDTKEKLAEVRRTLAVEMARTGDERNEAYIKQLKEYEDYLSDTTNLYKASLELRLEQEEKQLEAYRNYLNEEKDALTKSLEDRKAAYEKYFDAVDRREEDAEYEQQAELLIKNIGKVASSGSAEAKKQTQELTKELEKLEEDRLKELRERAREQVLSNIDDEVSKINDKFDELLDNEQKLLAALSTDLTNSADLMGNMITSKVQEGATANQLEQFLGTLQANYGSKLGGADLQDIQVEERNNQLFLNVNGQEILLDSSSETNLYAAIMKALREIGLR